MITAKDLQDFFVMLNKAFPLPDGFKGSHSFTLHDNKLNIDIWHINNTGEVQSNNFIFDGTERLTEEFLEHELRPLVESAKSAGGFIIRPGTCGSGFHKYDESSIDGATKVE